MGMEIDKALCGRPAVLESSHSADDEAQAECAMMLAAEVCCMAALLAGRCETELCVPSGQKAAKGVLKVHAPQRSLISALQVLNLELFS